LFLKQARFFAGQIQPRKFRDVGNIEIGSVSHRLSIKNARD